MKSFRIDYQQDDEWDDITGKIDYEKRVVVSLDKDNKIIGVIPFESIKKITILKEL